MWLRCAPRPCQTRERCALRDIWPATALAPSAHVHLQPTHRCILLDSLLQCPVGSTAITTTIGGKVGAAFSAAVSYLSTSRCFSPLLLLLPRVAARRRGAA